MMGYQAYFLTVAYRVLPALHMKADQKVDVHFLFDNDHVLNVMYFCLRWLLFRCRCISFWVSPPFSVTCNAPAKTFVPSLQSVTRCGGQESFHPVSVVCS